MAGRRSGAGPQGHPHRVPCRQRRRTPWDAIRPCRAEPSYRTTSTTRLTTPPAHASDAALIDRCDESPTAFGELYDRHVVAVHTWLVRRIAWCAADLTAETFARAWLSRASFRDRRDGSALPWLLGIAGNLLADAARHDRIETRARQRLGLPLDLATDDGDREIEERLSPRASLARCVADLPAHERAALQLRIVDELPYEEVARRLSIRPAAARPRVSRALRRLAHIAPEEEL